MPHPSLDSVFGISANKAAELLATLTPREREVAESIASGRKRISIAESLGIAAKTFDVHLKNIKWKLKYRGFVDVARIVWAAKLAKR